MDAGEILIQNGGGFDQAFMADLFVEQHLGGAWWRFRNPVDLIEATGPTAVPAAFDRLRAGVQAGYWAAGFVTYEAAPAFDPAFQVRPPAVTAFDCAAPLPVVWFGLYRRPEPLGALPPAMGDYRLAPWRPALDAACFARCVRRIHALIAAGDTYQVNFTFPLESEFVGDPLALLHDLHAAQGGRHSALVATARHWLCSASPELFFAQAGGRIMARPMKGTAPRGRWNEEDAARAAALAASPKDRAENLMIVDLLRNDLARATGRWHAADHQSHAADGRLCACASSDAACSLDSLPSPPAVVGQVAVRELFALERYATVWQMTSTIEARPAASTGSRSDPFETLAALFPCGSITGAPKIRTMEIIADLEAAPRGVYTGAIGWIGPGGRAVFNVAIRTVQIARPADKAALPAPARYGVGAGITWSSDPGAEYAECLQKARVLNERRPSFDLIESLLWEPAAGYRLLARHLARLADSARYFDFACDEQAIRRQLDGYAARLEPRAHKIRLLLSRSGRIDLESEPVEYDPATFAPPRIDRCGPLVAAPAIRPVLRVALAAEPVDSGMVWLYHKTTRREPYETARGGRPGADDVLLYNERGELTESTRANLIAALDGQLWTPPRESGLLAGTLRADWLARGLLAERPLHRADLNRAHGLWLINSVRGWMPFILAE